MTQTINDPLERLISVVDQDAEARGWDQPNQVFVVAGEPDDPYLDLVLVTPDHLPSVLEGLVAGGHSIKKKALGLALTTEGWRFASMDEVAPVINTPVAATHPRLVAKHAELFDPNSKLSFEQQKAWYEACLEVSTPANAPDWLHKENRTTLLIMRTGEAVAVMRTRGEEVHSGHFSLGGRLVDAARKFLGE